MQTLRRVTVALAAILFATTAAQAEIKVGFVTSLSGPAASIGIPYSKGIAAAVEYANTVNGEKIKLIQLDDGSDPSAATRNARKLVEEEKVDILMGTASSPSTIAMVAVANELKVPMIAISPITPPKTPDGDLWTIDVVQPPLLMSKVVAERMGTIIASAIVAHTGWHWMVERWDRLSQYRVQLPEWNASFAAGVLRWLMLAFFFAGLIWWIVAWQKRRTAEKTETVAAQREV